MILLRALLVAVGLVLLWQAVILLFAPPPYMLPPPIAVFSVLAARPDLWPPAPLSARSLRC
jgi:putative hydroxymethylpyrimidine transport system permease protein